MPYKSKKIPIAGTKLDRRRKLSPEQKRAVSILSSEGYTQRQLAEMFNYSRRSIQNILHPQKRTKPPKYHAHGLFLGVQPDAVLIYKKTKAMNKERQFNPSDAMLDLNVFFSENEQKIRDSKMQGFGFFFDIEEDGAPGVALMPTFIKQDDYDNFTDILANVCDNNQGLRDMLAVVLGKYFAIKGMRQYLQDHKNEEDEK